MRPEVKDAALLLDMLESAKLACQYAEGKTRESLDESPLLADAIDRRIEIVGEASRKISAEWKAAHPEFPWKDMSVTRNILAHAYGMVDHDIIWEIVQMHLPELIR